MKTTKIATLAAGKKRLLVASRNLRKGPQRANVEMAAQNGRQLTLTPRIKVPCAKQRKGKGKKGKGKGKKGKGKRRNRASVSAARVR